MNRPQSGSITKPVCLKRQQPEQLQAAAGLGWRVGCRMALELLRRGLTGRERRGRFFYHRLTRAADDALLLVVAWVTGAG